MINSLCIVLKDSYLDNLGTLFLITVILMSKISIFDCWMQIYDKNAIQNTWM